MQTGIATVPPLGFSGKDQGGENLVRSHSPISEHGRQSLTLPRPGEQRKDPCEAATGSGRQNGSFKVSRSQSPIPAVKPEFPAPFLGLMEIPAAEKRPFPVPCWGQMETYY